jgi:hypothetical protein
MTNEERDIQRELRVLQHAEKTGHARKACRYFGIGRSSFLDGVMLTKSLVELV